MPAYVLAALVIVAAPATLAVKTVMDSDSDDHDSLVSVVGTVTAYITCHDEFDDGTDDSETEELSASTLSRSGNVTLQDLEKVITAFVIDNETIVRCGPWWYWATQSPNITDVVHIGDTVNVTGEIEYEDNMTVLCAWKIVNITTGEELTIKEDGRPPWAGGPNALVLVPWPSEEDE